MDKAKYIGTVSLDFLQLPGTVGNWQTYQTEDIFAQNLITMPHDYLFTLGSGIFTPGFSNLMSSLATIPQYRVPTTSQYYVAGRDVIRWGGEKDPLEIDFDRYGFTPDFNKGVAIVWKAPKFEPHHLSEVPEYIKKVPNNLKDLVDSIVKGKFAK
jgi:hypothetical protein